MSRILIKIFLLLLCSQGSYGNERRDQLVSVIDEQLQEIRRLVSQSGPSGGDLLLRLAELELEKARHIKDGENSRFLSINPKKRGLINKEKFFKKSRKNFLKAQRTCNLILKKFPKYRRLGAVFYILAFNAKEFQENRKARKYFSQAVSRSKKNSLVNIKSKLALAEMSFNEGNFKTARKYYKNAIKSGIKDKWHTKNLYNLAWSNYRLGSKSKAIKIMKQVHKLSEDKKYVDMSKNVERDLAYFYSDSGKIKDAIKFYKGKGKNIVQNLIKVGKYLLSQGKYTEAQKTFNVALRHSPLIADRIIINVSLLSLYERFGKTKKHFNISKELVELHEKRRLSNEQYEILKYHVSNQGAILQKQVVGKRYARLKKRRTVKARHSAGYFELYARIFPNSAETSYFHGGESLFAAKLFSEAMIMYEKSKKIAYEKGNRRIVKLSAEGMMASVGKLDLKDKKNEQYLTNVYLDYLKLNPRNKKAFTIYQRLFSVYYGKKDIGNSEKVLLGFQRNFPKSYLKQEAMLARIMEHYKKTKNRSGVRKWVRRIKSGDIKVSKKYAKKVRLYLLSMQFRNVERASSKGDKKRALIGYVEIYRDKESTAEAKKNSAYNIAILFHELGDVERTYGWGKRALEHMGPKDLRTFEDSFLAFGSNFFGKGYFMKAAEIYHLSFDKLCRISSKKKKVFFKNASVLYLSEGRIEKVEALLKSSLRCKIPLDIIENIEMDIVQLLIEKKSWNNLSDKLSKFSKTKRLLPKILYAEGVLARALRKSGRSSAAKDMENKILDQYDFLAKRGWSIPVKALDLISELRLTSFYKSEADFKNVKLAFPEKIFNDRLQLKFTKLEEFTSKALKILSIGSGRGVVRAYKKLIFLYEEFAIEVETFSPSGKGPEYVASFKKTMRGLVVPIRKRANSFRKEVVRQIERNNILSVDNNIILRPATSEIVIKYYPVRGGILMDKGGRK